MNLLSRLLILALLAVSTRADITANANVDYVSTYVFRGVKVADQSIQSTVSLGSGGLYASVWTNTTARGTHTTEIDYNAGLINETGWDLGATVYTYPGATNTWEPYLGFSHDLGKVNVGLYGLYDGQLKTTTFEGRSTLKVYTGKSLALSLNGVLGHSGGNGLNPYTYWLAGSTLTYTLTKHFNVATTIQYTSTSDAAYSRDHFVGHVGIGYSF